MRELARPVDRSLDRVQERGADARLFELADRRDRGSARRGDHLAARKMTASEARRELESRLARTPQQLANELAKHYGHALDDAVTFLQSRLSVVPGWAMLRTYGNRLAILRRHKGQPRKPTASHMSGHLIFADLAERTGDKRYVQLVKKAADLGFHRLERDERRCLHGLPDFCESRKADRRSEILRHDA